MKAMIFAAGLGTRLKPFTLSHPKALAPVNGVPMLERVIIKLRDFGISQIVVNVHHFAQQIIDFIDHNNSFGIDIAISDESQLLLDTGGGILAARKWLDGDEDFIVHNVDILSDVNLKRMAQSHSGSDAQSTLLVSERVTSRYLLFDNELRMRGWTNKSTGEIKPASINANAYNLLAFDGIHILSPSIFPYLDKFSGPQLRPFSIMDFYIDFCQNNVIEGFKLEPKAAWFDIGKPATLAQAQQWLITSENQ